MIKMQTIILLESLSEHFFPADEWLKILTADQNRSFLNSSSAHKCAVGINRSISSIGMNANVTIIIVTVIVFIFAVNRPL